jgi:hypothetical protein
MDDVAKPLACPRCALTYPLEERFCTRCGMPLTYSGRVGAEEEADEGRERARKVKPQYARGELRRVATARHQAEAEFIQMLLLDEGVPSTLRRASWDVPEMLAAGPRDVLVPESGVETARQVLLESELAPDPRLAAPSVDRSRFVGPLAMALGVALFALVAWLLIGAPR